MVGPNRRVSAPATVWTFVRPLLGAAAFLVIVSIALFVAVQVLPGDPVSQALGTANTPANAANLRRQLGLDAPLPVRYVRWIAGLVRGDLGRSAVTREPIGPVVAVRSAHSLMLGSVALAGIIVVGVGAGTLAGARPGSRTDRCVSAVAAVLNAVPEFALAILLVTVVAIRFQWLPAVSAIQPGGSVSGDPVVLILPASVLILFGGAYAARMVRAVVADVVVTPHVDAARIAGLPERTVLARHVLPVVVGPVSQVIALLVPYLVGGALVVETVFAYPGLGAMLAEAVSQRDAAELSDCGLILAAVSVVSFLLAEVIHRSGGVSGEGRVRG